MTERKSTPQKHWLVIPAVLVIACLIGGIVYFLGGRGGRETGPSPVTEEDDILLYNGERYRINEGIESVLVMGIDRFSDYEYEGSDSINSQQADFLMLLLIDKDNHTCIPLHINRDTMCSIWQLDIYGEPMAVFNGQITLAHAYGSGGKDSCRNQVRAVSELLYGRKIDHYISLTMDAVSTLNDMVGGVTVTVLDDFSQVDDTLVQGREVTLTGDHALTYVRQRFDVGDGSNLRRMERQRQYMSALQGKLLERTENDPDFALKAITSISDSMVSDCSIYELSDIVEAISNYEFADYQTIAGEAVMGEKYMEFYADEDALYQQVIDLFYVPAGED